LPLKRDLGLLDVFCIASGAMISSGLFVLPGVLYAELDVGPAVFLCYLLASVLMVPAVMSKAELASALPKSGGTYYFIDRSVGPAMGTLGGVAAWASLAFKTSFAVLGIGLFSRLFLPALTDLQVRLIGAGVCVAFMVLNLMGARHAGRMQVLMVLALLGLLTAYSIGGLGRVQGLRIAEGFHREHLVEKILLGAGMVFISFGGVTKVASIGEEVRDPGRNLARGMLLSFVGISALYVLVVLVTSGILPSEEIHTYWATPLSAGGRVLAGRAGYVLMGAAALLAFVTTANAGILSASRIPMAMSRDGLLPEVFGRVGGRRGTPWASILVTSGFVALVLFLPLGLFVKTASSIMILLFMFTILSLILMRESGMENYQPRYRSPGYPWLHVAGVLAYGFLLVDLGTKPLLLAVVILGGAFAWYMGFVRARVVRESALTLLARRIASKALGQHDLEAELAQIVRERDRTQEDDFDRLVRTCPILDLPERVTREQLFHAVASWLSHDLGVPPAEVHRLLNEREAAGSTVVRPGLAIPHVVLDGEGLFDLMLVRCRQGILFEEDKPPVHTVFVLIGSKDMRQKHLQALMAVAEIVQDPAFEGRWLRARNEEQLRRLILQSKRRREIVLP